MKIINIKNILNKNFPFKNCEKWDKYKINNNFFLNQEAKKILVSLDINKEVISYALKFNCNMIISHHPLFIGKENSYVKELKKILFKNKITHISLHTNYDFSIKSMSFKLTSIISDSNPKRAFTNSFGWIGNYNKKLSNLINDIQEKWEHDYLISDKFIDRKISNFYFASGAGSFEIEKLLNSNSLIDVYISGEIKWHLWNLARDKGKNLIDVGHGIEKFFIKDIKKLLENQHLALLSYPNTISLQNIFKIT